MKMKEKDKRIVLQCLGSLTARRVDFREVGLGAGTAYEPRAIRCAVCRCLETRRPATDVISRQCNNNVYIYIYKLDFLQSKLRLSD